MSASPVETVFVVVGHRADEVAAEVTPLGARCVLNEGYSEGMLTSVQCGVAAAEQAGATWAALALCDQPLLPRGIVEALLARARESGHGLAVPAYGGRRGHPLLIHRRYFPEMATLPRDRGLKELLNRHSTGIAYLPVPDDAVLRDMDTREDYRRELQFLAGHGELPGAGPGTPHLDGNS